MQRANTTIDLNLCDETSLNSEKEDNDKHKPHHKHCVFQLNCIEKSYFYILHIQQKFILKYKILLLFPS